MSIQTDIIKNQTDTKEITVDDLIDGRDQNSSDIAQNSSDIVQNTADIAQNSSDIAANTSNKEDKSNKGIANGYPSLDASGFIPQSQLPASVDEIIEVANFASLPATGEASKIYVTLDNNKAYRWSGSAYIEISASLVIGTTSGTAYDGASGQSNANTISSHIGASNPHSGSASSSDLTAHTGASNPHSGSASTSSLNTHTSASNPHSASLNISHQNANNYHLTSAQNSAMDNANSPSAGNPIATIDDLSSVGGSIIQKSSRSTEGTWTITGLTIGRPLYIISEFEGAEVQSYRVRIRVMSGTLNDDYDAGTNTHSTWPFSGDTMKSITLIPDSTSVVIYVPDINDPTNGILRAFQ